MEIETQFQKYRKHIGHAIFFGSYFFVNNPFLAIATPVRFSIFVFMIALGVFLTSWRNLRNFRLKDVGVTFAFSVLYLIALIRIQETISDRQSSSDLQFLMGVVSLFCYVSSRTISINFDAKIVPIAILLSALPCGAWICLNYNYLGPEPGQTDPNLLGNLSSESYQTISMMLGLGALSSLRMINFSRLWKFENVLQILILFFFSYFVLQGNGRGEAIGFAIASLIYLFPRLTIVLVPIAIAFGSTAATYLLSMIDTPFSARMLIFLDGDYGGRDELFGLGIRLISDEPQIMLFGGGLDYFQSHWRLSSGNYPHNLLIEAIIVGGLPFFSMVFLSYFAPVLRGFIAVIIRPRNPDFSFCLSVSIFLLFIAFKSGTLTSFWNLGLFTCIFSALNEYRDEQNSEVVD